MAGVIGADRGRPADSVAKLRRIAQDTNATVVTGHDPSTWPSFRKAPHDFYD